MFSELAEIFGYFTGFASAWAVIFELFYSKLTMKKSMHEVLLGLIIKLLYIAVMSTGMLIFSYILVLHYGFK